MENKSFKWLCQFYSLHSGDVLLKKTTKIILSIYRLHWMLKNSAPDRERKNIIVVLYFFLFYFVNSSNNNNKSKKNVEEKTA